MRPIYKNGEIIDYSDNGKQAENLQQKAEIINFLKGLTIKERQIVSKIMEGYSHREICKELKISSKTLRKTLDRFKSIIE